MSKPPAAPKIDNNKPSPRSCPTIRVRLAPSAVRIAISRCRAVERASKRLVTFAHAMSNTNATAARIVINAGRTSPTISSCNEYTRSERSVFDFGYCFSNRAPIVFISASHCWTVTPGFIRPTMRMKWLSRLLTYSGTSGCSGCKYSARSPSTGN